MSEAKDARSEAQQIHSCCVGTSSAHNQQAPVREGKWTGDKMPRIELLYFAGCPTYQVARRTVAEVLEATGMAAEIREVNVSSEAEAHKLGFIGSPTIRIDGQDIDPDAERSERFGLKCRVYTVDGRLLGHPSREMVLAALKEGGYVT
jgi:hypothetical protein